MPKRKIPRVESPVKNGRNTLGDIVIEPDGSFSGKFHNLQALQSLIDMLADGFADGVLITTNTQPAYPAEGPRSGHTSTPTPCLGEGCMASIVINSRWDNDKAVKLGWFIQRDGSLWCPVHIPDWVEDWREKKRAGKKV